MRYVQHAKAEEFLQEVAPGSVDLVLVDPPYFKVKDEPWDKQWSNPQAFLAWIEHLCTLWRRVLKPNGSLYVFASPRMAARVEVVVSGHFEVLNRIRWIKAEGWHKKAEKEALRSFLSPWEEIIFAELYGADNSAKGVAGYATKREELRGFVFESLRAYLDSERVRAGWTKPQVDAAWCAFKGVKQTAQSQKWFSSSCWNLPTPEAYEWLRQLFNGKVANEYLQRDYEELRRDYEELRRDYEELRRPFSVSADVPFTDVWDFPTVRPYPGKHVCEKPQAMLEHIIRTSSRPGALVLDCFAGSGATGVAALNLGRRFIGCDASEHWANYAEERLCKVVT